MSNSPTRTPPPLSRRTVVKGAAWSIPVIAAAVAAPMAAASGNTPANVGPLVESSDNIKDGTLSLSSARVEQCFEDGNTFQAQFTLTAVIMYDGSDADFTLDKAMLAPGSKSPWSIVEQSATSLTLVSQQLVSCYAGIAGFEVHYKLPKKIVPPLNSISVNITGISADGKLKIGGYVSALHGYGPVVGPRVHDN